VEEGPFPELLSLCAPPPQGGPKGAVNVASAMVLDLSKLGVAGSNNLFLFPCWTLME